METFVIRLWSPTMPSDMDTIDPPALHGVVEHVGSGGTATFKGAGELLELLSRVALPERATPVSRVPPA